MWLKAVIELKLNHTVVSFLVAAIYEKIFLKSSSWNKDVFIFFNFVVVVFVLADIENLF